MEGEAVWVGLAWSPNTPCDRYGMGHGSLQSFNLYPSSGCFLSFLISPKTVVMAAESVVERLAPVIYTQEEKSLEIVEEMQSP